MSDCWNMFQGSRGWTVEVRSEEVWKFYFNKINAYCLQKHEVDKTSLASLLYLHGATQFEV